MGRIKQAFAPVLFAIAALAWQSPVHAQAAIDVSNQDCSAILESYAADPKSVPKALADACQDAMLLAPAAGAAALSGDDVEDPCSGPDAAGSVRCWGPWPTLSPQAGGPGGDSLVVPEFPIEPRPEQLPDPSADDIDPEFPLTPCEPGLPCGFATVVAGGSGTDTAENTQFAKIELANDGSSFGIQGDGVAISSGSDLNTEYAPRPDQFETLRAGRATILGILTGQPSELIARVLRENDELQVAGDFWSHNENGTENSGYFAWGRTLDQAEIDSLVAGNAELSFSGPMSVDNATIANITLNYGATSNWNGNWTNPAYSFSAGGDVTGANFLSNPSQFSSNVESGFVQGALVGAGGVNAVSHVIEVSLAGQGLIRDVGLLTRARCGAGHPRYRFVVAALNTAHRASSTIGSHSLRLVFAALAFVCAGGVAADTHSSAHALLAGNQPALLERALADYRALAADGGWLPLNPAADLRPGVRDPEVRLLRQRLRLTGDFSADMNADPLFFDTDLLDAVRRFQARHGLQEDGRVSGQTRLLLNQPVEQRIAELEYARRAWSNLPPRDARRRVWVNIPEAVVSGIADERIELSMRAVVGHPTRSTPVLSSAIRRVIVNPAWTVPTSIAGQDLLPRQLADADFFRKRGFQVFTSFSSDASEVLPEAIDWQRVDPTRFPYRLRQKPGPDNSLGRFKFEFPNDDDIYLHDTPARALLGLSVRSLSSGCVRAEDSASLARWLVGDSDQLARSMQDTAWQTRAFPLGEPVPIDLVYLNAWVSADGRVNFRRDVYRKAASP